MRRNANTNSVKCRSRAAKKKPSFKRGLGSWFSDAYRWLHLGKIVYDNREEIKAFIEKLIS